MCFCVHYFKLGEWFPRSNCLFYRLKNYVEIILINLRKYKLYNLEKDARLKLKGYQCQVSKWCLIWGAILVTKKTVYFYFYFSNFPNFSLVFYLFSKVRIDRLISNWRIWILESSGLFYVNLLLLCVSIFNSLFCFCFNLS